MDRTGTTLGALIALSGLYIAGALLLARIRDSAWGARQRRRLRRAHRQREPGGETLEHEFQFRE